MHRSVIALILASVLTLTTLDAAPAAARDRTETAAAAGGAAILVLLAAAIAKKKRQDRRDLLARQEDKAAEDDRQRHAKAVTRDHGYRAPRHGEEAGYRRAARVQLPGACRVRSDHRAGYSGRCLQRYDYDRAALPSACASPVGGSHRTIYRDRCLNGYGYY